MKIKVSEAKGNALNWRSLLNSMRVKARLKERRNELQT